MTSMKATAVTHMEFPGYVEEDNQEVGDWTVTLAKILADADLAPFFKGGVDDLCQASHMGYVLKGKFGIRTADGDEQVYEAGEAFLLEPGHTPINYAGSEYVAFTPTAEAEQQAVVMMPNLMEFAKEHGIDFEFPEQRSSS